MGLAEGQGGAKGEGNIATAWNRASRDTFNRV